MDHHDISADRECDSVQAPGATQPSHYVGIGASAGGLEAIETFFTHMTAASGLAFIVIQHLSPDYKSLMVELLSKKTEMTVLRAEDGMVVEPDKVYLIPPKKNLTIFHGKLLLNEQDVHRGLNLPIDIFLRSLAEDQGEKAVGVILSGTGSDGMRGARAIKENGGMIMVQDEETAKFDGMPRATISTGLVDFILPPEDMPKQLLAFAKHPYTSKAERAEALLSDEDGLTRIFALLREKSKVDFTFYKPSTVTRRIERRMSVNHFEDIRGYVEYMQEYPGEVLALYRELLIGVTSFFRDREAFNQLSEKWLPELLEQKQNRETRFWVAGCSTGEEAYTLAIVARECMEQLGRYLDVKIFATDVDKDAILRAGSGVYPASIAADLSKKLLSKYFYHKDDNFQIARNIREMVVFAQHNLIKDPPFTNIDLLSCRNLLIYLQPVLQKRVLEMMNFSLNANGLLMLGTSETVGDMGSYFHVLSQKYKIHRSTGRVKPSFGGQEIMAMSVRKNRESTPGFPGAASRVYTPPDPEKTLERFLESITGDLIPLSLIVNSQLEVQHVIGDSTGYLKVPSGRISNDLSKMAAKDISIPLTTGIQKVFRENEELRFSNIHLRNMEATKSINLRIKPLPQKKGQEPLVAVFLNELRTDPREIEDLPTSYDISREAEQRIRDLEQELQFSKENLQATIEELETANEELQATNEELLASNEELQSTNEELQSTNEELHTVNAEYQNKIIELTELNNDVENLLSGTQIGTLLLDENLEIRKFSPQVTNILRILENDAGRPVTHINHHIVNKDPFEIIRYVRDTYRPREEQILLDDGRWYLMRVMPYSIGPQKFSGIVVSFVEFSHIKETQEALVENEAVLKRTARLAKVGSWEYNVVTGEHKWSEETFNIHELEPGDQPLPENGINFYSPEARPIITEAFGRACEKGEPYDLVLEIITARGNHRWVRAMGSPQMFNGKVVKVSGAFQDITELKEVGEALKESETKLKILFDILPVGVSILDEKGNIVFSNPYLEKILGVPKEKLNNGKYQTLNCLNSDGRRMRLDDFAGARAIRTNRAVYNEMIGIERDDQSITWANINVVPVNFQDWRVMVVASDITDLRKAEESLQKSEKRYRELFTSMGEGFALHEIITDDRGKPRDYRFLAVNPAFEKLTGLRAEKIIGRTVLEVLPQTEAAWIERYGRVALTGEPHYFEDFSGQLGKWYRVAAYSPRLNQFSVIFSDITDHKLMDKELEDREEQFRSLFETMAQGVVYQDADGKISQANPAAERILGLTLDQMQGRTSRDRRWRALREDGTDFPGDEHPAMLALKNGKPVENVIMGVFNPADNEEKWININAVPQYKQGEDKPYQVYTTFEDLTFRLGFENELKTTKKRFDFAFGIARLGWWDWDMPSNKVKIGPNITLMLGYEPGEIGRTYQDLIGLIHGEDLKGFEDALKSHFEGKTERYDVKYRLRRKNGTYR